VFSLPAGVSLAFSIDAGQRCGTMNIFAILSTEVLGLPDHANGEITWRTRRRCVLYLGQWQNLEVGKVDVVV
jgi:hypothetical protein